MWQRHIMATRQPAPTLVDTLQMTHLYNTLQCNVLYDTLSG